MCEAINTIWKFPLKLTDRQTVEIPAIYHILCTGFDGGDDLCVWAAVDREAPKRKLELIIVGTGHPLPHVGDFIGTVVRGSYVWHIFTGPSDSANALQSFHYVTQP